MMTNHLTRLTAVSMMFFLASCAVPSKTSSYQDDVQQVLAASFRAEGQAGMDRLTPDEANRLCSEAEYKDKP